MTQTGDVLRDRFRAPDNEAYENLGSELGDRRDGRVYVHDPPLRLAVRVAIATRRPLLLRGPAGSGKSSLAPFVARLYERRFYKETVTARTEARDLMWHFDALRRLNDAQVLRHAGDADVKQVNRIQNYIEPRALWWAFDPASAARRGVPDDEPPLPGKPLEDPGIGLRTNGVVVLIDEIDKADPDVPNNLLESLGSLQFTVLETGRDVRANPNDVPLVIITTNDERELPAAFYRRCVVHVLKDHDKTRLVDIASYHFDGDEPDADPAMKEAMKKLYAAVATELERYRAEALKRRERQPSTAEYLDAVRACRELELDPTHDDWKHVARLTLTKRADEGS